MTTTAEPATRTERALAQVADRNGKCISGTCKCETYELAAVKDGFATCVCSHTRWAHSKIAP